MALLLGLTGNWGKKGTGTRSWSISGMDGEIFLSAKQGMGQEAAQQHIAGMIGLRLMVAASDPTMTAEMVQNRMMKLASEGANPAGFPMPPAFLWYYQYGCKERWNNHDNVDPTMKRSFDQYSEAKLLVGMCMDNRKLLRLPDNFAFVLRTGGANLRYSEFKVARE